MVSVVIKVGNTQIYLTDLTKDTAHWHFIDDFYSDNISDKFIYYVFLSKQDRLKSQVRKASIPRLSKVAIDKITFYLPSITEQERIVSILDNFNTLTNSLLRAFQKKSN